MDILHKYYLYRHIRLDRDEVFYVGIGTKKREFDYSRANSKYLRNFWWNNITEISEYIVEIIMEAGDYGFIKEKEKEFIKIYGRADLKKGTLCNLTDGGEGSPNTIVSEKTRKLHSDRSKGNMHNLGNKYSEATKKLMSENRKGEKHPMFGKKASEESKQKMREAQTGSKKSEETRQKHRERASLPNQCNRKPCILINIETNEELRCISMIELSVKSKISKSTLNKIKKGLSVSRKYKKYKIIAL